MEGVMLGEEDGEEEGPHVSVAAEFADVCKSTREEER